MSGSQPVSIFLNTSTTYYPAHFLKNCFLCHIHRRHILEMLVTLCWAKPNDWRMCWRKLSQLTNHRAYQELVYLNEVLKTMLAGSTTPFLPSFHTVFVQSFFTYFLHYLGDCKRLNNRMENTKAFWILDRKITMHSICFSCCAWQRKSVHQNIDNATIDFHWMKQDFTIKLRY